MAGLITFTVILVIMIIIGISVYLSRYGEIVAKDEQAKAAVADFKAAQQKSNKVRGDAIQALNLYLTTLDKALRESRELLKSNLDGRADREAGKELQQIFEVYPKHTGEEVYRQALITLAKERDDVQFALEKANAYIAKHNAEIKKPISGLVAETMEEQQKRGYLEASPDPLIKELLEEEGKKLLALGAKEEKGEENLKEEVEGQ